MTTYRLQSSAMVGAPGIIAWAINGYHFAKDRPQILRVITQTWNGVPEAAAHALLTKAVPYQIDDIGTVTFEHEV